MSIAECGSQTKPKQNTQNLNVCLRVRKCDLSQTQKLPDIFKILGWITGIAGPINMTGIGSPPNSGHVSPKRAILNYILSKVVNIDLNITQD